MIKSNFTSRGQRYELLNKLDFCDVYYYGHNTSEEYILHCLDAEMQEFTPNTVIFTQHGDTIYFYIDDKATFDDIINAVFVTLTLEDLTVQDAVNWACDVADNLKYINSYNNGNVKETSVGVSNSDCTCGKQAKIQWTYGGVQVTIQTNRETT